MKRVLSFLLLAVLLCGCVSSPVQESSDQEPGVVLRYYTIGGADKDLALVSRALSELTEKRYGFGVEYYKIDFNEYADRTNAMINTNEPFDVMFTWGSHYSAHGSGGAFLDLTPYLQGEAYTLYNTVDSRLWQGVRMKGKIYGVPTNKELAPVAQFLFSESLLKKYHINPIQYRTLESLEPILSLIKEKEPNVIPMLFTSQRLNLTDYAGYEYIAGEDLPFVVRTGDPTCEVVNIYDTPEMRNVQTVLRRYYEKGYINPDAVVRTSVSRFSREQVFCQVGIGGPEAEQSFSVDYDYPIVSVETSIPCVTNISARGGIMAISAKTKHPQEAISFLNAVNLDPDVRNLLNYGIEGVHYTLTEENQVHRISSTYRGIPYSQGNWYILKTMEGENPEKWEHYRRYNDSAVSSRLLGFEPNLKGFEQEISLISKVYQRYDNALLTGSVDPEKYRAIALDQMDQSGFQQVREELQRQVDAWRLLNQLETRIKHE